MSIFKQYCRRHNIILHRGNNMHILCTLAWNHILRTKLKIYKWLHGIHRPIVHYYAVCWNEEKMLPFMFDYYERFVNRFTLYDNHSTDSSRAIIGKHPTAKVIEFESDGFDDSVHRKIKNNCWKKSRGKADMVIVCDIDEFLYHEHLDEFIRQSIENHYSILKTTGYHMYSKTFPSHEDGKLITDIVKHGVHDFYFDKQIIFDPHRIIEINYDEGAHKTSPLGIVKTKESRGELKMLHYKNLSVEQLLTRSALYAQRLSKANIDNHWGEHYLQQEEQIRNNFDEGLSRAKQIIP